MHNLFLKIMCEILFYIPHSFRHNACEPSLNDVAEEIACCTAWCTGGIHSSCTGHDNVVRDICATKGAKL